MQVYEKKQETQKEVQPQDLADALRRMKSATTPKDTALARLDFIAMAYNGTEKEREAAITAGNVAFTNKPPGTIKLINERLLDPIEKLMPKDEILKRVYKKTGQA